MIRIFVGTEPKTRVMDTVLRNSILSRTTEAVQITLMLGPEWEIPTDLPWGTGFSLKRFLIPRACQFSGSAIYLDADQIVLDDIKNLHRFYDDLVAVNAGVGLTYQTDKFYKTPAPQTSVMVLNCDQLKDWEPESIYQMLRDSYTYYKLMHLEWMDDSRKLPIPIAWNRFNSPVEGDTCLLHFTKEDQQPIYNPQHKFAYLWIDEMKKAIASGVLPKKTFIEALSLWHKPKIDRRPYQGLHPHFNKYLNLFS